MSPCLIFDGLPLQINADFWSNLIWFLCLPEIAVHLLIQNQGFIITYNYSTYYGDLTFPLCLPKIAVHLFIQNQGFIITHYWSTYYGNLTSPLCLPKIALFILCTLYRPEILVNEHTSFESAVSFIIILL